MNKEKLQNVAIILFSIILTIMLILGGCWLFKQAIFLAAFIVFEDFYDPSYDGWYDVEVEDFGTIKLPEGWTYKDEDGLACIYNDEGKLVIAELDNFAEWRSNEACEKYKYVDCGPSSTFPNHSRYGIYQIHTGETVEELYYFSLSNDSLEFIDYIVWDKSIDKETVKMIAHSYDTKLKTE